MSKILFVKHGKDIEAGYEYKNNNGIPFFSANLVIKPREKEVWTNCGDAYYDYSIGFKEFLEIADKIKEIKEEK